MQQRTRPFQQAHPMTERAMTSRQVLDRLDRIAPPGTVSRAPRLRSAGIPHISTEGYTKND